LNIETFIEPGEAMIRLKELEGATVSHAWRGHGSAIFLEFGELKQDKKLKSARGEQTLMVEWSWRFEGDKSILVGSWDDDREIDRFPNLIFGKTIESINFLGRLFELEIKFSDSIWLSTFSTQQDGPSWSLRLKGEEWLSVIETKFRLENTT
jgi:hypothetical protein